MVGFFFCHLYLEKKLIALYLIGPMKAKACYFLTSTCWVGFDILSAGDRGK